MGKSIRPIELIKSRTQKQNSLLTQLWFERAAKTIEQLNHLGLLIDQFEFMADVSFRL